MTPCTKEITLLTRWAVEPDSSVVSPDSVSGEVNAPLDRDRDRDHDREHSPEVNDSAAKGAQSIQSHTPPDIDPFAPVDTAIGGWIVDQPGLKRTFFGLMDPRAPSLDRVAESFALYCVDRFILF